MAKTKLKNLEVNEVSLVDAGANQHAHVKLYKNRSGAPGDEKGEKQTPAEKQSGIRTLFSAIGKALKLSDDDVNKAVDAIEKADTFGEKMQQRKLSRITDEIWDVCYALESSLCSIMRDEDVTDKESMMNQSIDEFVETIKDLTGSWSSGKTAQIAKAEIPIEHMQESAERLDSMIAKACGGKTKTKKVDPEDGENPPDGDGEATKGCTTKKSIEGGYDDMKFNEASMTAADRLAYEELKKRYAITDEAGEGGEGAAPGVKKSAGEGAQSGQAKAPEAPAAAGGEAGEDIYKGLHPAVRAEIETLKKRAEAAEERELQDVAKKYELIGKKPEDLVPMLKSLKAAGGTAYDDMIGVLDAALTTVEASGTFNEIGKRGVGNAGNGDAWSKIEKHAKEIRKADPKMGYAESIDAACVQHPDLVKEYEDER